MKETSLLEASVSFNIAGRRESINYKWIGKSPYVRFSYDFLDEAKRINGEEEIQIGPYRLLLVDRWNYGDYPLYVRADKLGALRVALYKSTRLLDLIYRRMIITLAVWRLADCQEAYFPTWRDIKIIKKLRKKIKVTNAPVP